MDNASDREFRNILTQTINKLSSKDPGVRSRAEAELEELGPQNFELVLEWLETAANRDRRKLGLVRWFPILGCVVLLAVFRYLQIINPSIPTIVGLCAVITINRVTAGLMKVSQTQKNGVLWLSKFDSDPRAACPMIDSFKWGDESLQARVESALANLLPVMTAEDVRQLSFFQISSLYDRLTSKNDQFVVGVLAVLGHVGIRAHRENIQKLANGRLTCGANSFVRSTAKECLAKMDARAALGKDSMTLLHPASAPSDLLLRAHSGPSQEANELLLRASDGETALETKTKAQS